MSMVSIIRRQLRHTIVSTKIIKPTSPTPPHLKIYNLSVYDQLIPSSFSPMVLFYPNSCTYHNFHDQIIDLKNSLSHTLTKYYPFAGKLATNAPTYVDCNDDGAEFIEASTDSTLSDFLQNSQLEDLDQLFPYGRTWNLTGHDLQSDTLIPLAVKVTRFECKGLAVAVSLSHKMVDGYSLIQFISGWAEMTRAWSKNATYEIPTGPHFISFENKNINFSTFSLHVSNDRVTRSFVFPSTKIHELKLKVSGLIASSGQNIINPTRVEVVIWLLYKCAVRASTKNNLGSFKPAYIRLATNLRDKMIEPLPENCIGNYLTGMEVHTSNEMEMKPELIIGQLRDQKKKIKSLKNIEAAFAPLLTSSSNLSSEERQRKFENTYVFTSLCGFPSNLIDFGWGTPIKATVPGNLKKNSFVLMDASNGEGVEVLVCLGKQDMNTIQTDSELLSFAHICEGMDTTFLRTKKDSNVLSKI